MPCGNGKTALSLMEHEHFDSIILDLRLPDISGISFLQAINQLDISLPPIVIYTAKDLDPEEEELLLRFSDSVILKGARSPERLLDEINLFLHRVESALPEDQVQMLARVRAGLHEFEGHKVLLVDDDVRNVFALTAALETRGLAVEIAKSGPEALALLDESAGIDLVLTDIMMPEMSGYDLIRRIRTLDSSLSALPIVALTAKARIEDHEAALESGANDYLAKPVNLTNLLSVLRVWLPADNF
ncbi:response regulator [Haliangium ochraceum]|uniref:response regulator n=1 Tax=Haliangium ochraceum TaxID=80816 RepID=UPI00019B9D1D